MTTLHIDSSARFEASITRQLTADIAASQTGPVVKRDLAQAPLPHITEDWVAANFTPAPERTEAQAQTLALSDILVAELQAADTVVIGLPIYNFGVPAALKAWIDLIARAGLTFKYGPNGPEGLLTGKRAIIAVASGGTASGSDIDFATPYLKHALGFVGITDVTVIAADQLGQGADEKLATAKGQIAQLAA